MLRGLFGDCSEKSSLFREDTGQNICCFPVRFLRGVAVKIERCACAGTPQAAGYFAQLYTGPDEDRGICMP